MAWAQAGIRTGAFWLTKKQDWLALDCSLFLTVTVRVLNGTWFSPSKNHWIAIRCVPRETCKSHDTTGAESTCGYYRVLIGRGAEKVIFWMMGRQGFYFFVSTRRLIRFKAEMVSQKSFTSGFFFFSSATVMTEAANTTTREAIDNTCRFPTEASMTAKATTITSLCDRLVPK